MADYITKFCAVLPLKPEFLKQAHALFAEVSNKEELAGGIYFIVEGDRARIEDSYDCGNYDDVIHFVRALRAHLGPKMLHEGLTRWGFQWANTCNHKLPDAFGGGAWMIDLETGAERIVSTATWLEDEENAEDFIANMGEGA